MRAPVKTRFSGPGPRTGTRSVLALVCVVVALSLLVSLTACSGRATTGGTGADDGGTQSSEASDSSAETKSLPELNAGIDETIRIEPLEIRVASAGPARLHPQAPQPEPGMQQVSVRVLVKNATSDPLPINGTPYSVYKTTLDVSGTSYPGALVAGVVQHVQSGAIPPGVELDLRYVFEIPKDTQEGVFVWRPVITDGEYPVIRVPLTNLTSGP